MGEIATTSILSALERVPDTEVIQRLFEDVPKTTTAILSPLDGQVKLWVNNDGVLQLSVTDERSGICKNMSLRDSWPSVRDGEMVSIGQLLTHGEVRAQQLLDLFGLKFAAELMILRLSSEFLRYGVIVSERHLELCVARMTSCIKVMSEGYEGGGSQPTEMQDLFGKVIPRRDFMVINNHLVANGQQPIWGSETLLGLTDLVETENRSQKLLKSIRECLRRKFPAN